MIALLKRLDDHHDKTEQETTGQFQSGVHLVPIFSSARSSSTQFVLDALNDERSPQAKRIYKDLVTYLWDLKRTPGQREWVEEGLEDANSESANVQQSFRKAIIDSLAFETIQGREEAIPKALEKTFSWIVKRNPTELDGKLLWSSFPEWLEHDIHQPYWITGKPGSGKSTLMKFILQHPLVHSHLQKWAINCDLLVTRYYAWNAGSDLQKSCEGLRRTLLYQALKLKPWLISKVAPRRWSLFVTLRRTTEMPAWQPWEIEESFKLLLTNCGLAIKLAVFVDGLDEFKTPPFEVLELIQHMNSLKGIKVCVASRQWTEYSDTFYESPMLRMQDLTTADMVYFIGVKFESNRAYLELKKVFPTALAHLLDDVVKKADGVFLWLSLVVKALLEALTEGDGLPELQETVDQLPSDIAQLYDTIWSRISLRNISASSKLLVTYRTASWSHNYLTLWLADEKQSLDFDIGSLSGDARSGVVDIMKRRLDSRTRGILEISDDGTVNFLHRTARDWTLQSSVWEMIRSTLPDGFDPYLLLLKAETIRLPELSSSLSGLTQLGGSNITELWNGVNRPLWYASQVENSPATTPELVRVLNKLDNEVDKVVKPHLSKLFPGSQQYPHWSSTQPPSLEGRSNTFLGLMAQFCVLSYLQTNLSRGWGATKSNATKNCVSLLENAVFGYPGVSDPRASNSFAISFSRRLETVSFLLEKGASPRQLIFHGSGISVIDQMRAERSNSERKMSSSRDYWIMVEQLTDTKLKSRRNLKYLLGWRKGL